jgi:hypothetical protein
LYLVLFTCMFLFTMVNGSYSRTCTYHKLQYLSYTWNRNLLHDVILFLFTMPGKFCHWCLITKIVIKSNTTGATNGAEDVTVYHSVAPAFTLRSFVFRVVLCISLFLCLSFFCLCHFCVLRFRDYNHFKMNKMLFA